MASDDQEKSAPWRTSDAELRWKLALSLVDPPPPVPPKDPPKLTAPPIPTTPPVSRPGTATTTRPGTARTTKSTKSTKSTRSTRRPFLLGGTMSSSRPGTAGARPSTAKTTASEKRPNTAVTNKTAPFSPTFTEATSLSAGESLPTTVAGRTWARIASKVTMTPLKPVKISNPMRGFGKSLSLRRYDSQGTVSTLPPRIIQDDVEAAAVPVEVAAVPAEASAADAEKRPATSSTKRLSHSSTRTGKTIKFAVGKHAGIELSPQPSDDVNDPLVCPT